MCQSCLLLNLECVYISAPLVATEQPLCDAARECRQLFERVSSINKPTVDPKDNLKLDVELKQRMHQLLVQEDGSRLVNSMADIFDELDHPRARLDDELEQRRKSLFELGVGAGAIITLGDISDESDQFIAWTKNLGLFASDNASLDYRLRDAIQVRDGILLHLKDLADDLRTSR